YGGASISSNLEITGANGYASSSFFYAQPGTALLPAFTFGNDPNSGLYRIAADTLGFATNATERFRLNNGGASLSYGLEINAASSQSFIITDLGGTQDPIFTVNTTASQSNPGLDIVATTLTRGNTAFTITVPASTSAATRLPAAVLLVKDALNKTLASMDNGGKFAIRGPFFTHGSVTTTCANADPGTTAGCIDYAEAFPATDNTLTAGEVVSIDVTSSMSSQNVARATPGSIAIGVISTNPATLVTGAEFVAGNGALASLPPGHVPIALAGRVPVKVSTENGPILAGDYLTNSATKPGLAMKSTQAGQTIGQALTTYDGEETGEVIIFVQTGFYGGPGLDATAGVSRGDPTFESALLKQFSKSGGSKLKVAKNSQEMQLDVLAASNEIITPRLFVGEVTTEKIKNQPGKDLRVELEEGRSLVVGSSGSVGLSIDSSGNAVFAGSVTANKINGQISGLDEITNQVSALSGTVANLSAQSTQQNNLSINNLNISGILTSSGDNVFNGSVLFNNSANFLGDTVLGSGTASTSLTIYSDAYFRRTLSADKIIANEIESPTLTAMTDRIINLTSISADIKTSIANLEKYFDLTSGEKLNLKGGLVVAGESAFIGRVYFNDDTAGFAIIKKDAKTVGIKFTEKYAQQPIVNITISLNATPSASQQTIADLIFNSDIRYLV
ncbi:MAG: hypothetical protein Q7J73_02150, partial [Dehalococcoidales bacterium]|nr:hypothetical protein [Dehalococcoidales bacterium]